MLTWVNKAHSCITHWVTECLFPVRSLSENGIKMP